MGITRWLACSMMSTRRSARARSFSRRDSRSAATCDCDCDCDCAGIQDIPHEVTHPHSGLASALWVERAVPPNDEVIVGVCFTACRRASGTGRLTNCYELTMLIITWVRLLLQVRRCPYTLSILRTSFLTSCPAQDLSQLRSSPSR